MVPEVAALVQEAQGDAVGSVCAQLEAQLCELALRSQRIPAGAGLNGSAL